MRFPSWQFTVLVEAAYVSLTVVLVDGSQLI